MTRTRRSVVTTLFNGLVAGLVTGLVLAACGGEPPRELSGFVREPVPEVDQVALPDLSRGGEEFAMRAEPGELLVVFFGFTNCPDICPMTLHDVRTALNRMDDADAARVELAMVSVDPERDMPVLVEYVQSFVADARALATTDEAVLRAAADPFGVTWLIETDDEGRTEVAHTSQSFVVDDTGSLVLTWQHGTSIDDYQADLEQLLAERSA